MHDAPARIAAELVGRDPDPPRSAAYARLLRAVFAASSVKLLLALGLVFVGFGVLAVVGDPPPNEPAWSYPAGAFLLFAFAAILLVTPFLYAWRWWRALRRGVLGEARVASVRTEGPGSRTTVDAVEHGYAEGEWEVVAGDRRFSGSLGTDAEWVEHLSVGARLRVLVHPTKTRVWFALGPRNDGPSRYSRRST